MLELLFNCSVAATYEFSFAIVGLKPLFGVVGKHSVGFKPLFRVEVNL